MKSYGPFNTVTESYQPLLTVTKSYRYKHYINFFYKTISIQKALYSVTSLNEKENGYEGLKTVNFYCCKILFRVWNKFKVNTFIF